MKNTVNQHPCVAVTQFCVTQTVLWKVFLLWEPDVIIKKLLEGEDVLLGLASEYEDVLCVL